MTLTDSTMGVLISVEKSCSEQVFNEMVLADTWPIKKNVKAVARPSLKET